MYTHHFGLREKPFQIAPSPRFLYPSETHDESRARILYGIEDSRGFVVVYGRVGLGKTTVLLSALEELDAHVRTALIYQPVSTFTDLLRMTAHEFGLPSEHRDEVNLIWDLNEFFIQRLAEGDKCVLIIDEAQNLSLEILEKLRTLSNLQTEDASLLQIVLVGQPELYDKLMDDRLLQLRQRVGVWHEIEPLGEEDTTDYILHRLSKAGARRPKDIFSVDVCRTVHEWTQGVPRVINQVCDTALMIAYGKGDERVTVEDVAEAAEELHLVEEENPRTDEVSRGKPSASRRAAYPMWARVGLGLVLGAAVVLALWLAIVGRAPGPWSSGLGGISARKLVAPVDVSEASGPSSALERRETRNTGGTRSEELASSSGVGEGAVAVDPPSAEVGSEQVAETASTPAADEGRTRMAAIEESLQRIQKWRSQGRTVYTVHLYSFQQRIHAVQFAQRMARNRNWDQPIFLEKTASDPIWYRVFAGGFSSAGSARRWIDKLKSTQTVHYARLTRLAQDARVLLPAIDREDGSASGVRG